MNGRRKAGETSLIVTSMVSAVLLLASCWYGTQYAAERVLKREGEIEARGWADFLREILPDIGRVFASRQLGAEDERILHSVARAGRVIRYSLFDADGFLVRGSDMSGSGRSLERPQFDARVRRGDIVVELKRSGAGPGAGRLLGNAYVPVTEGGAFLGAMEVDVDMTGRAAELRRQQVIAFMMLLSSLAIAGVALGTVIRRRFASDARIRSSLERQTKELARSQSRLRAALEKADVASRAKAQFLANMSHELRTPLNAIIGFSEAISFELFGPVNNVKYRDYADDISSSGQHLLQLVTDILDFSKVEAGKLELVEKVVSLSELIATVRKQIQPLADEMNVGIVADLPPMDLNIHGDERRLRQILINLISNAIRFSPSAGQVSIGIREDATGGIDIRISDNGPGISADDLEKVMEPFQQIGDLITHTQSGTGLGVPIARALAELHGGNLRYESEPGMGTTAILHLPSERMLRMTATAESA